MNFEVFNPQSFLKQVNHILRTSQEMKESAQNRCYARADENSNTFFVAFASSISKSGKSLFYEYSSCRGSGLGETESPFPGRDKGEGDSRERSVQDGSRDVFKLLNKKLSSYMMVIVATYVK
ncbi:hypothetical protein EDD11_002980 [Mortierella claussenii]|nr:hypothetical protein EDD11_002980 [Mortierella claussenii]